MLGYPLEHAMHERHSHRPFAHGRRTATHRVVAHVARGEDAGDVGRHQLQRANLLDHRTLHPRRV